MVALSEEGGSRTLSLASVSERGPSGRSLRTDVDGRWFR